MTPRPTIVQLQQLERIMQQMLIEANHENWIELSRLDDERRVILNYPKESKETHVAKPAISSGQRPLSQEPAVQTKTEPLDPAPPSMNTQQPDDIAVGQMNVKTDDYYRCLSQSIRDLDSAIRKTITGTRDALLNESRDMKAQMIAKKGYETTNKISSSSYS